VIRRTLAIAVKEVLHLRRDPRTALTLLGMPVVLLFIFGFALSFDVQHSRLLVVDRDGSRAARELTEAFLRSGYFDLIAHARDDRALDSLFDSGRAQAALVIPADYGRDLASRRFTSLQFVLDGSDAQMATKILAYARQIVASVTVSPLAPAAGAGLLPQPRVWYNPELSSARFLVPGLVAFILMIASVIATALSVVREKERGTMDSLRATPLFALELLLGKTLPYLFLASASAAGALTLAWAVFGVPLRGSLLWLALVTVLFLLGGLGQGLFVSTVADSQQVAFQLGLFSTMLPTLLLSGFIFPISSMPTALQWVTRVIPARYFLVALREIVLKGVGIEIWWPEALALLLYAILALALGTGRTVRSL
jgi:ABC-2 type transport system permease protein